MKAHELREALRDLGMSQAELSRRCRTRPATVSRWCDGEGPPGSVARYVESLLAAKTMAEAMGFDVRLGRTTRD